MSVSDEYHCECDEQRENADNRDGYNMHSQQPLCESFAYNYALWHHQMALWWWNTYNNSIRHPQQTHDWISSSFPRSHSYPTMHQHTHDARTRVDPFSLKENSCQSCVDHQSNVLATNIYSHGSNTCQLNSRAPDCTSDYSSLQNLKKAKRNHEQYLSQNDYADAVSSPIDSTDNQEEEHFVIEVHEGFRKFLEISEKHRQERRKKQLNQDEDVEYVEVGTVNLRPTSEAPDVQPGIQKAEEMKELYGEDAQKMHSLETALQMHYDLNCDLRHPIYWPSIPLKF